MIKLWIVVVEELDIRNDAEDAVSNVTVFVDEEEARAFAHDEAKERCWPKTGANWVDVENTNGMVRIETHEIPGELK